MDELNEKHSSSLAGESTPSTTSETGPSVLGIAPNSAPTEDQRDPSAEIPIEASAAVLTNPCNGHGFISPLRPANLPIPGEVSGFDAWIQDAQAIPANRQLVSLNIALSGEDPVLIREIKFRRVGARNTPLDGTLVKIGCGEPVAYQYMAVDLDSEPPRVSSKVEGDPDALPYKVDTEPAKFPYQLTASGKPDSFLIQAETEKYDISWEMLVEWSANGETGTLVVDNSGEPFRVSSDNAVTAVCAWQAEGEYIPSLSKGCL